MSKTDSSRWDSQKLASSRAKRDAASAPRARDLKIYERFFKQALGRKKKARVLVLGATPELRDLSLKYNCETIAVDVSWNVLFSMHEVMKYKDHPKNKAMRYNWLELDNVFKDDTFDIVLADVSLNNISLKDWPKMMDVLHGVIKKGGAFISRHSTVPEEIIAADIKFLQTAYNKKRIDWLEFYWLLIFLWRDIAETVPCKYVINNINRRLEKFLRAGKVKFRRDDQWKIKNIIAHTKRVIHYALTKNDFEKMAAKHFILIDKKNSTRMPEVKWPLIYYFKVRK